MSDNAWVAAAVVALALVLHSCASCEKERLRGELELEKFRIEHAQKEN